MRFIFKVFILGAFKGNGVGRVFNLMYMFLIWDLFC